MHFHASTFNRLIFKIHRSESSKSQIGCALALVNFSFCQSSGPMVQNYCHGWGCTGFTTMCQLTKGGEPCATPYMGGTDGS